MTNVSQGITKVTRLPSFRGFVSKLGISIPVIALLVLLLAYVGISVLVSHSAHPFTAIASNSMQPALSRGDLVLVKSVDPARVEVGDTILFNVPDQYQSQYGYPDTIAHRVTEVIPSAAGLTFKTKGDATNPDPFTTPASSVRGEVSSRVRYLGYVWLFLHTRQGWIFLGVTALLYLIYWLSSEMERRRIRLTDLVPGRYPRGTVGNDEVLQKTNQMSDNVQQALNSFAQAMAEYAQHLSSHTGAVRDLGRAAERLDKTVELQNRTLFSLGKTVEQGEWDSGTEAEGWLPKNESRNIAFGKGARSSTGFSADDWLAKDNKDNDEGQPRR